MNKIAELRKTLRTVPSVPTIKGLNERQNAIFETVTNIIFYFRDDCIVENRRTARPKKTEEKTMLVIGPLEITMQTTVYYPSEVTHHELKIVYDQRIRFQLFYDSGDKAHTSEVLIDQSTDIEMLLKKILRNQEEVAPRKVRI